MSNIFLTPTDSTPNFKSEVATGGGKHQTCETSVAVRYIGNNILFKIPAFWIEIPPILGNIGVVSPLDTKEGCC